MSDYRIRKQDVLSGITDVRFVTYTEVIVPKSGGTFTGAVEVPSLSATTFSGDGSNLTGIVSNGNFDGHTGDTTIHFTKSSINLSDLGSSAHTHSISDVINLQSQLDTKSDNAWQVFSSTTVGQSVITASTVNDTVSFSGINIDIFTDNTNKILTLSASTNGGGGEANTGLNVGNAAEIFRDKTGTTLNFRTLTGTTNDKISTYTSGDTVQIDINETNLTLWPLVVNGNKLISGGATYLSGLTFDVSPLVYIIGDTIYNASASTVTLSSGSTTFDRIDVIYADISGNTGSVEGVPSSSPSKPALDSATQVEVTFVTVPAGSTAPDVEITKVYDENAGTGGGEWDYSASTVVRISGDSTNDAYSGTKSIEFINAISGDEFTMDNPTPYDTSSDNTISFYIKNINDWGAQKEFIEISMRDSNDAINGNVVRFDDGKFGYDTSNVTDWQVISIALGDFGMTSNLVSKVRFQINKDAGPAGNLDLYIDLIRFQAGAPTTSPQNIWLSFVGDNNNVAVATSSTDQLRFSGGTNITTSINGKNAIFDLDSNISLTSVSATTISATTFYGDGSNLTGISAGSGGSALTETITAGENLVSGDLVYLNTDTKYWKASNTAEATSSTELRLATETINADASGSALVQGRYTTTGLTSGSTYWVGASGDYTETQPTGDGDIVRYVGTALSDTELEFNPDGLYIEISSTSGPSSTQPSYRSTTSSGSVLITDWTVDVTTTADTTQTLPLSTSTNKGKVFNIKNSDSSDTSSVTIATTSGQLIDNLYGNGTDLLINFPQSITLQSTGSGYIII